MAGITKTHVQLGDSATATNNFMLTAQTADGTMKLARGNNGATTQDILTVDTNGVVSLTNGMLSKSSITSLGYATGAGGAVTQLTSKTTTVTLNTPTGQVTMNAASLAAAASVTFNINNSIVGPNDLVVLNLTSGSSQPDSYAVRCRIASQVIAVTLTNYGGTEAAAIVLQYSIIKGAVA